MDASDVLENEVFRLEDFEEFQVILRNRGGIVDFEEWVEEHGKS